MLAGHSDVCGRRQPGDGSPDRAPLSQLVSSTSSRCVSGSRHHLICDPGGTPLGVTLTGGNRNGTAHG